MRQNPQLKFDGVTVTLPLIVLPSNYFWQRILILSYLLLNFVKIECLLHGQKYRSIIVIIVCKKYYIDTLVKELGINNVSISNPTYIPIDDSFETIVKSYNQFITSVGLEMSEEDQNLPCLYCTPKLHKSPYKHWFIAASSKCTTKDLCHASSPKY